MTITTYHINYMMKSYFSQNKSMNRENRRIQQSVTDTVRLSTAGRKRIFKKMKEHALDQVIIQTKGK
jgi:phosphoribosyl-ATP pyrophosphohydrolase